MCPFMLVKKSGHISSRSSESDQLEYNIANNIIFCVLVTVHGFHNKNPRSFSNRCYDKKTFKTKKLKIRFEVRKMVISSNRD